MIRALSILFLFLLSQPIFLNSQQNLSITNQRVNDNKLNLLQGQKWKLDISFSMESSINVLIYDYNLNIVNVLKSSEVKKQHSIVWNGLNKLGETVNSGLYFYRLQMHAKDGKVYGEDMTLRESAKDVKAFWPKWDNNEKKIRFKINQDALIRLRVGLENSGLIKNVAEWIPVYKSKAELFWDGWDENKEAFYGEKENLKIDIVGISLPSNYINVISKSDLPSSYLGSKWLKNAYAFNYNVNPDEMKIAHSLRESLNGRKIKVILKSAIPKNEHGEYLVSKNQNLIDIVVPNLSEEEKKGQAYEVVFFCDGNFVQEELIQNGMLSYKIPFDKFEKGSYVYNVNVILGSSQVGVASFKIKI